MSENVAGDAKENLQVSSSALCIGVCTVHVHTSERSCGSVSQCGATESVTGCVRETSALSLLSLLELYLCICVFVYLCICVFMIQCVP